MIIYMRSRAFRNFTDAAVTKRQLAEKGVTLVSVKEDFGEGYMADAMEAGAKPITLGHRILRTETAGLAVLSVLMFQLEDE